MSSARALGPLLSFALALANSCVESPGGTVSGDGHPVAMRCLSSGTGSEAVGREGPESDESDLLQHALARVSAGVGSHNASAHAGPPTPPNLPAIAKDAKSHPTAAAASGRLPTAGESTNATPGVAALSSLRNAPTASLPPYKIDRRSNTSRRWIWAMAVSELPNRVGFVQLHSSLTYLDPNLLMFLVVFFMFFTIVFVCGVSCCLWRHGFIDMPFVPAAFGLKDLWQGMPDKPDEGHMIKGKWMVGCEAMPPGGKNFKWFAFKSESEAVEFYNKVQVYLSRVLFDDDHMEVRSSGPNFLALNNIRRRSRDPSVKPIAGAWNVVIAGVTYGKCAFYAFDDQQSAEHFLNSFKFVSGIMFDPELKEVKSISTNPWALSFLRRTAEQAVQQRGPAGPRGRAPIPGMPASKQQRACC